MRFKDSEDPRWGLLTQVRRPARYVGGEFGAGPVKEDSPGLVRVCLAFPDVYEVGMSYLGYQILYALTKSLGFADAERAYAPWIDMEALMRSSNTPLWALESGRPLSDFDVVAFTLQYELSMTNILTMLDLGGIALKSADRDESSPIVIAGGPGALVPGPISPFIDAFCVGDGEIILPEVLRVLSDLRGRPRSERLAALSKLPGVYVPCLGGQVVRQIAYNPDEAFINDTMIVPNMSIIHDRVAVQAFKGCTRGCRFCQAGMIDRPVRERSAESVVDQIEKLLAYTGWEETGLLSLATCDWSGLARTLELLSPVLEAGQIKLSLPSIRMDAFSVELAARLASMRRGGLTFAPEAGSARLRAVINKGVSDSDIDEALDATFRNGWDRVKLYFMMGLPTETESDLDGAIEIAHRAFAAAKRHKRRGEIAISLAGFVPKAHTPFQWEAQATREQLRERGRYAKGKIHNKKMSLAYHEPDQTYLEGVFARGDERLAPALEEAWRRGARFDGWTETFNLELWLGVFNDLGIDADSYAHRVRGADERLPWDFVDTGISKEFLIAERGKAFGDMECGDRFTPDCRNGCNLCGWHARGCPMTGGGSPCRG